MNSLIWQSVMWRPGKMAVPHQREEPASYPAGRDRQPTRAFQGRAVRRIRNVSRATPSRRHESGDTFSSRLTLPSHPDCRAADRAASLLGISPEALNSIAQHASYGVVMEGLRKIGVSMGEATLVGNQGIGGGNGNRIMT